MVKGARAAALAAGEMFYVTGKPCKRGHEDKRRSATGKCVGCEREWQKTDKHREYHRNIKRTEKYRAVSKAYRESVQYTEKYKLQVRKTHLKRNYNMTLEEYDMMHDRQGGKCAICQNILTEKCGIDHCHTTGVVRGILCFSCNKMLGMAGDDTTILHNAICYLNKYQSL